MPRKIRLSLAAVVLNLVFAGMMPTLAHADGGGGGGGGGGGIGGGGGGGGAIGPRGDCGAGSVLGVYSASDFGPAGWPSDSLASAVNAYTGKTLGNSVWQTGQPATNNTVYLVDPATGLVKGPPSLGGYNGALGEGIPPGGTQAFTGPGDVPYPPSTIKPYANSNPPTPPSAWPFYPWWNCYTGSAGKPAPPAYVPVNPKVPQGQTAVNFSANLLVQDPVTAAQADPCPTDGAPVGLPALGIQPPSPPAQAPGQQTVVRWPTPDPAPSPNKCPQSLTVRTFAPNAAGNWDVIIEQAPVPDGNSVGCTKGSGGFEWEWRPISYVGGGAPNLSKVCTDQPSDVETLYQVLDCQGGCPAPPPCNADCTNYDAQRNGANAGISVKLTVNWRWYCYGWFHFWDGGPDNWVHTFPWSPAGFRSWTPPDGQADIWITCDPGVTQYYQSTSMRDIQQIEAVAK